MPVGKDSKQIPVILPKGYVEKLEKLAEQDYRTRSQQAAKIIIDYLNAHEQ